MLLPFLFATVGQARSQTPDLAAWEKLKYGMFIHYGMSTFDGAEINDGKSAPSVYAPTNLNVRQWVHVAKQAGMKYAVLTAKHTAGFCLWPSGGYDISLAKNKTDVVGEFMKACKEEGIQPGIYYCIMDGHNEDGVFWDRPISESYFALIKQHLTQLHTRYPGIFEQWLDIPGKLTLAQRTEIFNLVHQFSPHCLVLMNVSIWERPGTAMPPGAWPTDLAVGERHTPPEGHNPHMTVDGQSYYLPLEICDPLTDNWFWVKGDQPRSVRRLYKLYDNSVNRGANLLLDVAPDTTGQIPDAFVKRLMELKAAIKNPKSLDRAPSLTFQSKATASNIYRGQPEWDPSKAVDDDDSTRWACDDSEHHAWLELDLGTEKTFTKTTLSEAYPNRVKSFEIQSKVGDSWHTFYQGKEIGANFTARFPEVKARFVRLKINDATIGPSIWEFNLYPHS